MTVTWTGFLLPCGRTKANAPCLAVRSLPVEIRYIVIVEEGSLKTLQIRQVPAQCPSTMITGQLCDQTLFSSTHARIRAWSLYPSARFRDTDNKLGTRATSCVHTDSLRTKAIPCFAYP